MTKTSFEREQAAEAHVGRQAFIAVFVVLAIFWVINASSIPMELARSGRSWPLLMPWVLEATAPVASLALFPAVRWFELRFTFGRMPLWRAAMAHVAGSVVFAIVVIVWMHVSRATLWPILFDRSYSLFSDGMLNVFVYEYRKVATVYAGMLAFIYMFRSLEFTRLELEGAREEARRTHRLTLKCGGRTVFVEADGFQAAKAAGNYVEIKLATGRQLARLTLAELERQLRDAGVDAVRVHRSWLVNRASIAEIAPTGEGDVSITLSDGDTVPGSRRYRAQLAA
jgi:uncharacterized integral membrane protein